ncbi:radical SAM protein [Thalassotalea sp. 1_MG-2023]|uniref:radical SAM protein n=1 Tax=Thalassotalea sp. 1_MG-2023 TaxID=3062680 RepID=UPI0026E182DB|nr:radical SAM protein [Thalassotalea sp. 1_MG-2023]MDO6428904.1 radical SAM protein [Thalassotalea sp. 1_MG-2023]
MESSIKTDKFTKFSAHQIIPENVLLTGFINNPGIKQIEISPTDACNQNCQWCFTVSARESKEKMSLVQLKKILDDFHLQGGISIVISGGGEPLLYSGLITANNIFGDKSILEYCFNFGFTVGLITNGVYLDKLVKAIDIKKLAFLRVSIDTLNEDDYYSLHGAKKEHFQTVIKNITIASNQRLGSHTPALGLSFIVDTESNLNSNNDSIIAINTFVKKLNIDFVQFKHLHTTNIELAQKSLLKVHYFARQLEWLNTEFWVQEYHSPKPHEVCYVTKIIQSFGNKDKVFPCCHLFGNTNYIEQKGQLKTEVVIKNCPSKVCRYVSINNLLTEVESGVSVDKAINTLKQSIEEHGFHPYRYFPTAPDLIFPVTAEKTS